MHERPASMRQSPSAAVRAARTTAQFLTENVRVFVIATVAGVFLALSGAFETGEVSLILRLAYWIVMLAFGSVIGAAVAEVFTSRGWLERNIWLQAAGMVVTMTVPLTLLVGLCNRLAFHQQTPLAAYPAHLFPPVLMISAGLTAINLLASRTPRETHAAPAGAAPPRFLERLPLKLRGAEIWAVEAQDHYLRLHTSKGQDLILMRLSDAVAELEGLEGAQTHRSWWVAKDALTGARRGDGRATLTLKGGAQVPVSRAYAKALREAGWF
jgi:hypothetical protein